jgi:hypothetical protein
MTALACVLCVVVAAPLPERSGHWRQQAERLVDDEAADLTFLDSTPWEDTAELRAQLTLLVGRRGLREDDRFPGWSWDLLFEWERDQAWPRADSGDVKKGIWHVRARQKAIRGLREDR